MERTPAPAMRTALAQTLAPVSGTGRAGDVDVSAVTGSISTKGIAVTGRVLRGLGLVLLLLIAILPG